MAELAAGGNVAGLLGQPYSDQAGLSDRPGVFFPDGRNGELTLPRHAAALAAGLLALAAGRACPGAGHLWSAHPAEYPRINRIQAGGGVVTYSVDFAALRFSGQQNFPPEQIAELEAAAVRAFDKWNEVLEPVGFRFERRDVSEGVDIPVFAFRYERYIPIEVFGDTVAGSTAFPLNGVMNFSSIVIDADEPFEPLDLRTTVMDGGLHHPYLRYVDYDGVCMYTTMVHEIGHGFGLGHPQDMFSAGRNFDFLALESVQIDAGCLAPSDYLSGEDLRRRGRFIASEIDSVMAPLQIGSTITDLPPEDRAFVAFVLREVDPEGADEILRRAREIFQRTYPLRFANVIEEHEYVPGSRSDDDSFATAMPVQAGQIILGSLPPLGASRTIKDQDYYRFVVSPSQMGRQWIFDVDRGGGLTGANWVDAVLELYDAEQTLLTASDEAAELDEGSFSVVDPYLTWTPPEPGDYYLRLIAAPGALDPGGTGDYELKIGLDQVPEPAGQAAPFVDPSVQACGFEPLTGRPLTPVCGLFDMVTLTGSATACLGLAALGAGGRRRHRDRKG